VPDATKSLVGLAARRGSSLGLRAKEGACAIADVDPEILNGLGLVTVNFAMLELNISVLIWALTGGEQAVARQVTFRVPFSRLLQLLGQLATYRFSSEQAILKSFKDVINLADQAREQRNGLTHAWWTSADKPGFGSRIHGKPMSVAGFQDISIEDVRNVANVIATAVVQAGSLLKHVKQEEGPNTIVLSMEGPA